jgi:hypothetical protein
MDQLGVESFLDILWFAHSTIGIVIVSFLFMRNEVWDTVVKYFNQLGYLVGDLMDSVRQTHIWPLRHVVLLTILAALIVCLVPKPTVQLTDYSNTDDKLYEVRLD